MGKPFFWAVSTKECPNTLLAMDSIESIAEFMVAGSLPDEDDKYCLIRMVSGKTHTVGMSKEEILESMNYGRADEGRS